MEGSDKLGEPVATTASPAAAAAASAAAGSSEAAAAGSASGAEATSKPAETINVRAVFNGTTHELQIGLDDPVSQLVNVIAAATKCAAPTMKIMFKGLLCGPNRPDLLTRTLREAGVANNAKLLVVGATAAQLLDVISAQAAAKSGTLSADEPVEDEDSQRRDWKDLPVHKRVLAKGKPADATFAYRPGQDVCPLSLVGMLDSHGKVRFRIILEQGTLIISTNESSKTIPFTNIQQVIHTEIPEHPEYVILGLMLGTTMQSVYYVYWFPAQYVDSFKKFLL